MSTSPISKSEIVIEALAKTVGRHLVINQGGAVVVEVATKVGQACLANPIIITAGAATAIAAKELAPHVAPYVKPVVDPVINITQKYPKTTIMTSSALCSSLLPFAATGEPITVAATWVTCSVATVSLAVYLLKDDSKESQV